MLAGLTVIDAVVAPPGLHAYVGLTALVVATSTAGWPAHTVNEFTLTVGTGFTVTVPVTGFATAYAKVK